MLLFINAYGKLKQNLKERPKPYAPAFPLLCIHPKGLAAGIRSAHPRSQQHYSQWLKHGSHPRVKGQAKCGISTQWGATQP